MTQIDISDTFRPRLSQPRSLYVHIPFCRNRCGYCNFTLVAGRDDLVDRFLDALGVEVGWIDGRHVVKTVFLGGGTPSHLTAPQLRRVFDIIHSRFDLAANAEITIECNPNDMSESLGEAMSDCGVNRISFGVQSFRQLKLKFLERTHTCDDIATAVSIAQAVTNNISFDLIFATENESLDQWTDDLNSAIELNPNHLSTYELTIEKGTQFWNRHFKRQLSVPDEDARADQYLATIEILKAHGFEHYEISSFCKPNFKCRHNLSYWNGGDYFAFGPGAARYIDGIRENNHRSTTQYIKLIESGIQPIFERDVLAERERAIERIVFGLRQIEGIDLLNFKEETGVDALALMGDTGQKLIQDSFLQVVSDHCRLTNRGILFYDTVANQLLDCTVC